ncbi:hypothetical protein ACFOWX_02375 [Sphingorhabdus arenilitoris]|uniref:DUF2059 domain-containing protein n=1 Tax=Sphingorhabdus arenilitoris TaxID=1490041 RepID=A0ABV8RE96_9SPHN
MKRKLTLLLTAIAMAGALPAMAQSDAPAAVSVQDSEKAELLQTFASLYLAEDIAVQRAAKVHDQQFLKEVSADAASMAAEKQHPGMLDAAMTASREATVTGLREVVPTIKNAIVAYADPLFTADDLKVINAFYMSNEGQRLLLGTLDNVNSDKLAEGIKKRIAEGEENAPLQQDEFMAEATVAAIKAMDANSMAAVTKFSATKAGQKFTANAYGLVTVITKSMNEAMQSITPKVQAATRTAVQKFLTEKAAAK